MDNEKRLVLTRVSLSLGGVYAPTSTGLSMDIAGATIIAHPELSTIDMTYQNISLVDVLPWEEVSFAHTLLCSNGRSYLILISNPDLFYHQKAIAFEILSYPDTEIKVSDMFAYILKKRIVNEKTFIYQSDLEWL
jgi:hypothetical protein